MKVVSLNFFYGWKSRKNRCWACGFTDTIKWGKQGGKQRYRCNNCGVLFTGSNPGVRLANQQIWFEKWIIERLTYRYLSVDSGYSQATLKRLFKHYLSTLPEFIFKQRKKAHLIIDGTYFTNDLCLVLYQDNDIKYTQLYRFSSGEYYLEIKEDLENLDRLNIQIESITCDGHKPTLKAIKDVYPHITIQRCLVHVHRMANIWLRQKPKTQASIDLKEIVRYLPLIRTHNDRKEWMRMFNRWYDQYFQFVNEKVYNRLSNRWWYRHKLLRRTTTMIKQAIPDLFHYLDNPMIPRSTNSLESFFGHLKDSLSIHRGLSYKNRKAFILWYLYLKNSRRWVFFSHWAYQVKHKKGSPKFRAAN